MVEGLQWGLAQAEVPASLSVSRCDPGCRGFEQLLTCIQFYHHAREFISLSGHSSLKPGHKRTPLNLHSISGAVDKTECGIATTLP